MSASLNILPPGHPSARTRPATSPATAPRRRRWWRWSLLTIGAIGLLYVGAAAAVFFAVKWHLTDTPGVVDPNAAQYNQLAQSATTLTGLPSIPDKGEAELQAQTRLRACQLDVLGQVAPRNVVPIQLVDASGANPALVTKMIFAAVLRLPPQSAARRALDACVNVVDAPARVGGLTNASLFPWANAEEWGIVSAALKKDQPTIDAVSKETGVPSRMIVSVAIVEQLRLYFTEREMYKKFFQPLKILGNATQFAWGVMAIKEKTAIDIEKHAQSAHDIFYPGPGFDKLLALPSVDTDKTRFARLTDEHNHVYSYRYGATELQEFMSQWRRAGWPIDDRPEILATLFNIGFGRSKPSANPQVGGSTITVADTDYTFGGLAFEFYYSGELATEFPFPAAPAQ